MQNRRTENSPEEKQGQRNADDVALNDAVVDSFTTGKACDSNVWDTLTPPQFREKQGVGEAKQWNGNIVNGPSIKVVHHTVQVVKMSLMLVCFVDKKAEDPRRLAESGLSQGHMLLYTATARPS
ncbi:hypothetical protein GX48_04468 [Paracoccidioides brasiliensis]|nr:hypothetical protein GX48_04468 [Paracoccidioides brasiliensis]